MRGASCRQWMKALSSQLVNEIYSEERVLYLDEEELTSYVVRELQLYLASLDSELFISLDEPDRLFLATDDSQTAARTKSFQKYPLGHLPIEYDKSIRLDSFNGFRAENVKLTDLFAVDIVGELPSPVRRFNFD